MFERLNNFLNELDEVFANNNTRPNEADIYIDKKCAEIKVQMRMEDAISVSTGNIRRELVYRKNYGIYKYNDLISDEEIDEKMKEGSIMVYV